MLILILKSKLSDRAPTASVSFSDQASISLGANSERIQKYKGRRTSDSWLLRKVIPPFEKAAETSGLRFVQNMQWF